MAVSDYIVKGERQRANGHKGTRLKKLRGKYDFVVVRANEAHELLKYFEQTVEQRVPEKYHDALKNCADRWEICMNALPGAREFCEYVKDNDYGIYILSNASDIFYSYFPKFLPLEFFNGVFVSFEYHMLKPDVEIYEMFLEKYGLNAGECLFIDDREDNCSGAKEAGFNTFCFKGDYQDIINHLIKERNS